jgi:hypothetical protein
MGHPSRVERGDLLTGLLPEAQCYPRGMRISRTVVVNTVSMASLVSMVIVATLLPRGVRADASVALTQHDARLLSAAPDAPITSFGWRGAVRTKVSIPISIVGGQEKARGFLLRLLPLIELHNALDSPQFIPHEQWRGRLGIEGGWRWQLGLRAPADSALSLALGVEHESDHQTRPYAARSYEAVVLNDVVVRGELTTRLGGVGLTGALIERVHFLTCTTAASSCASGDRGSASFETGLEAVADWDGLQLGEQRLRPYAALALSWLLENDRARRERRLALRAGICLRHAASGLWQLYFQLLAGNDVGIERDEEVLHVGGGIAWSL